MRSLSPSRLAAALDRFAVRTSGIRVLGRVAALLREAAIAAKDPLVEHCVGGFTILLPLSHRLPQYRRAFPLYDTAIKRLAMLVHGKYPSASVVDIGANVGDTAAAIRSGSPAPLLCVEGADDFFPLLEKNVRQMGPNVFIEKALVGEADEIVAGTITVNGGTAHVVTSDSGSLELLSLDRILSRHPGLPRPALVKIDTDGFDCPIVMGSTDLWLRDRPILFFEYDPDFYAGWNPLLMWDALVRVGYSRALVFENTGEYECQVDLVDRVALEDLHLRFSGYAHSRYADVAVFPAHDSDIATRFRDGEVRASLASRGLASPAWLAAALR